MRSGDFVGISKFSKAVFWDFGVFRAGFLGFSRRPNPNFWELWGFSGILTRDEQIPEAIASSARDDVSSSPRALNVPNATPGARGGATERGHGWDRWGDTVTSPGHAP